MNRVPQQALLPATWAAPLSLVDRLEARLHALHLFGLKLWTHTLRAVCERLRLVWADTERDLARARYLVDSAEAHLHRALADGQITPAERAGLEQRLALVSAKVAEAATQLREGRVL